MQIIRSTPKKPTGWGAFFENITPGLADAAQGAGQRLSGYKDPEIEKAKMIEELKNKSKMDLFNELGLTKNLGQNPTKGMGQREPNEPSQNTDKGTTIGIQGLIPEEDIIKASLVNPSLANTWQKLNDQKIAETRHQEEQIRKNDKERRQAISESYSQNKDYINKVYDQYEDTNRREAILERMEQLENSDELSDSGIVNLLHSLGFEEEWLKNPANEEYSKLALDLLGGGTLQADYGSKLFASEFQTSLKRIPSLLQTPEGRRQIRENIKTALLPARLKRERLQYYLDKAERTGEPLPHNIRGKILQDIKPQLEEAYDKFKQRNGRYKVKEGSYPDDNALEKYYYLSDGNEDKAMKMMKEDGYDIQLQ